MAAPSPLPPGRDPAFFVQDAPRLGNQYEEDSILRGCLARLLPAQVLRAVGPDLQLFGARVLQDVAQHGDECERHKPVLEQVTGFGRRADRVVVSPSWAALSAVAAQEGLIALGYERKRWAQYARIIQMAKLYLFHPSSATYTCPLAMADGAARVLELLDVPADELRGQVRARALPRLLSRDPATYWTSGQWMTERTGGSDVGNTETLAYEQADGSFVLRGYKFFTSAISSEMALTLARIVPKDGSAPVQGSRGLSLFYVEVQNAAGSLNNIAVAKLKDKLGTRALPTAELELCGTPAVLLGKPGKGVSEIAVMFNITRIHNAIASVSALRRGVAVVRDFSHRRRAFGKLLTEQPLHLAMLARLETQVRGNVVFLFDVIHLLGATECPTGDAATDADNDNLLRLLTPLVKLFTAKQAIAGLGEAVEALGGTGYMEDATILPRLLRDTHVTAIWEGTTNVLSLDLVRALARHPECVKPFGARILARCALGEKSPALSGLVASVRSCLAQVQDVLGSLKEAQARPAAMLMAALYAASGLLEHAAWSGAAIDAAALAAWLRDTVAPLQLALAAAYNPVADRQLALDLDPSTGAPRGCGDQGPHRSLPTLSGGAYARL